MYNKYNRKLWMYEYFINILGVVKRNPLFFHSISCKNNGFLFTTPNINMNILLTTTLLSYTSQQETCVQYLRHRNNPCLFLKISENDKQLKHYFSRLSNLMEYTVHLH